LSKEITNRQTKFVENYLEWKTERQLFPPIYSPTEYAEHLENMRNAQAVDEALEMIGKYELAESWDKEMIATLKKILNGGEL
jgi:hypothetical protein